MFGLRRNLVPDVATDQTSTDPLHGYVPAGISLAELETLRRRDPDLVKRRSLASIGSENSVVLARK